MSRDPIRTELESFDEVDLPDLDPEWEALAPLTEADVHRAAHFAATHYRRVTDPPARRFGWWLAVPALLVAAIVAIVLRPGRADLPPYHAEWRTGALDVRGGEPPAAVGCASAEGGPSFAPGQKLAVSFAPATEAAPREARAVVDGSGALPVVIGAGGVLLVQGVVGDGPLALGAGAHCLVAEIGDQRIELGFVVDSPQ